MEENTLEKNKQSLHIWRDSKKKNAVKLLAGPLLSRAQDLLSRSDIVLPQNKCEVVFCTEVAIAVEKAVFEICYKAAKLTAEYMNKIRSIQFNLRKNHALADEVLRGGINPTRLAEMSTDEMANKELKEYMARVRIQAEINVTLVTTDGPRIRKTHKGEELVEPLRESSRSPKPEAILFPSAIEKDASNDPEEVRRGRQLTTQDFKNINVVRSATSLGFWNSGTNSSSEISNSPNRGKKLSALYGFNLAQDNLYSSEDSDRYSPPPCLAGVVSSLIGQSQREKSSSPLNIFDSPWKGQMTTSLAAERWVGRIEMKGIEGICTTGELMGGPESIFGTSWSTILDEIIHLDFDASPGVANNHLKDLCITNSTSVMVVRLNPMDKADETRWAELFDYFRSIGRYGVIGKNYLGCISAMYLIFLEIYDRVPAWFEYLDPPSRVATHGRQERVMLVAFAVERSQNGPPRSESDESMGDWNPLSREASVTDLSSSVGYHSKIYHG